MRLLHTSDWHLGQKFITGQNREAEQALALDWLLAAVRQSSPDLLMVSGDVFDVSNPPIQAERMYYQFLNQLKTTTTCRHLVIVGGNHDAPSKLDAPRELLEAFQIHIAGAVKESPADNLLLLKKPDGTPEALVAAIPFLRERDVTQGVPGEDVEARIARIRAGIVAYYRHTAEAAKEVRATLTVPVPLIATGHLYATGASASEEQRNIYLGNLDNISAADLDPVFDYIALGHIHKAQRIAGQERIRYSGSLIPLSFSEIKDKKIILIADFDAAGQLSGVQEMEVPVFRQLLTLRGTFPELSQKIAALAPPPPSLPTSHLPPPTSDIPHPPSSLPAWLKIIVQGRDLPADVNEALRREAKEAGVEILRLEIERTFTASGGFSEDVQESLQFLEVEDVFLRRCAAEGLSEEATAALLLRFKELLHLAPEVRS